MPLWEGAYEDSIGMYIAILAPGMWQRLLLFDVVAPGIEGGGMSYERSVRSILRRQVVLRVISTCNDMSGSAGGHSV